MNPYKSPGDSFSEERLDGRYRRWGFRSGVMCLFLSGLPWLGFGKGYAFSIPIAECIVPRLDLFCWHPGLLERTLYAMMEFPLHILGLCPPLSFLVFFNGEGPASVRPFMVFVFWLMLGTALIWRSTRRQFFRQDGSGSC